MNQGYVLFCPHAKEIKHLITLQSLPETEALVRKFISDQYKKGVEAGIDDPFTVCAILRAKPREHRWFGIKAHGCGLPGVTGFNEQKYGISMAGALFDGRWRCATPEEFRERREQDRQDAIAATGNERQRQQNDFKKAISEAFKNA